MALVNLQRLAAPEREVLFRDIALRTSCRVPKEMICKEFGVTKAQLIRIMGSEIFGNALRSYQAQKEQNVQVDSILQGREIQELGRGALEVVQEVMESNRPTADSIPGEDKNHALALAAAKYIMGAGGFGEVKKQVTMEARVQIDDDKATELIVALRGDSGQLPEQDKEGKIIDVTPEDIASGQFEKLIGKNPASLFLDSATPTASSRDSGPEERED